MTASGQSTVDADGYSLCATCSYHLASGACDACAGREWAGEIAHTLIEGEIGARQVIVIAPPESDVGELEREGCLVIKTRFPALQLRHLKAAILRPAPDADRNRPSFTRKRTERP